ncbi:MAG: hypothetical protein E4G96_06110 [Chrysiogenales bacterium]|nr:MAG: hypothetical protein E4G96_06110 [Chrysiogenales bacterium]
MNMTLKRIILAIIISSAPALTRCDLQLKDAPEIKTSGFLSDRCYQAILVIEPDQDARGLVASRKSAADKASDRTYLHRMALTSMADHAINEGRRTGALNTKANGFDLEQYRTDLAKTLSGFTGRGRTAFTYYNENHSMVVCYRLCATGLKNKMAAIIAVPEN